VRGAFAAPAVLALYSGSAVAMASNLRCVNNQVAAGRRVFPAPSPTTDHFVRVRLWSLRNHRGQGNPRWFLRGNDLQALTMGRDGVYNAFLQPGQWWQFDPRGAGSLVGSRLDAPPRWSQRQAGVLTHDGAWVAVRIDASSGGAGIIGVVDGTNSGSAVSGLCWASFVTAAR
jgi:hypothetical protein